MLRDVGRDESVLDAVHACLRIVIDRKPIDPEPGEDVTASGPNVSATYRFKVPQKQNWKGWSLVCVTPAPLVELKVPFELKDIPLP